jgi:hypothetical protein
MTDTPQLSESTKKRLYESPLFRGVKFYVSAQDTMALTQMMMEAVEEFLAQELQVAITQERERLLYGLKQRVMFDVSGKPREVEWSDVKEVFTPPQTNEEKI